MAASEKLTAVAESLYQTMKSADLDVLFDDRKARPGVMFADMELIGIPHRIVISDRLLEDGKAEYKGRTDQEAETIALDDVIAFLKKKLEPA